MDNMFESSVGGYSFIMNESDKIEVWENETDEYPISFIFVKSGSVDTEKKFHYEISDWIFKNSNK